MDNLWINDVELTLYDHHYRSLEIAGERKKYDFKGFVAVVYLVQSSN
jgi:hypothetical protein